MDQLFSLNYWFDLTPVRMSGAIEIGFFVTFTLFIVAGLVFRIMKKNRADKFERTALDTAAAIAFWFGGLGLTWLFLSFEEIQIFGARFWFLLLMAMLIVTSVRLGMYVKKEVPRLRLLEQSKAEANKYLPRRR
jgi:amino acid transporter